MYISSNSLEGESLSTLIRGLPYISLPRKLLSRTNIGKTGPIERDTLQLRTIPIT